MPEKLRFIQGNEACAEGAIAAGAKFFAGYPITPSSEIAEILARRLPQVGGKFIQMEDEIAAMGAIIGASLAGAKTLTATSGPGFSLKQENIGYACLTEVPCVIVNVMRGGPSTGLPTGPGQADVMQARWGTHGDHPIIALAPAFVRETFDLTVRAFNLSEKYRTPVILLLDEILGHLREAVMLPDPATLEIFDRQKPTCPPEEYLPYARGALDVNPLPAFGEGYRFHVTGLHHDETGFPTTVPELVQADLERLHRKIERNKADIVTCETLEMADASLAVFAYGSTARSAGNAIRQARQEGVPVGLFRGITLWPFPEAEIDQLAGRVKAIIVAEMNLGQMVLEVERCSRGKTKVLGVFRADGEPIPPEMILDKIREVA